MFHTLLEPIRCPLPLSETHYVCPYCLDLYPKAGHHLEHCAFAQRHIQLYAAGWSTPTSAYVLRSLRHVHFPYFEALVNLLRHLLHSLQIEGAVLVPIPVGSVGRGNRWQAIIQAATKNLERVETPLILSRKKKHSTRKSVMQIRERIVQQEYFLDESTAPLIHQKRVVLIDDNVTTGTTILGVTQLLEAYQHSEIIPVVIERHISARVLQRCPSPLSLVCPYYSAKTMSM